VIKALVNRKGQYIKSGRLRGDMVRFGAVEDVLDVSLDYGG
jgi:hypothetical protein